MGSFSNSVFETWQGWIDRGSFVAKFTVSSLGMPFEFYGNEESINFLFIVKQRWLALLQSFDVSTHVSLYFFFLPKYVDDLFFLQKNEAFTNALSSYVQDGFPVAICTGTTAWSNLAGNPDVAVNNSLAACKSINKCSGIGLINAQVTQCGNYRIFLSLIFYVKSILGILEVKYWPF